MSEVTALGTGVGGAVLLVACYLLGSLPFSVWIAHAYGVDVWKVGSGNPGATNVLRSAGRAPGVLALFCDVAKGVMAVVLARSLTDSPAWWGWAALAAVCGHVFSIFLRFRGGKGVATAAGALGAVSPSALGVSLVVFVLAVATTRYVSLGSMLGALAFPIALWFLVARDLGDGPRLGLMVSTALIALLVLVRHGANLGRLLHGTENKLGGTRTA
jgi:glycerol-3-phosphate acyltransferase PlsY